MDNDTCKSCGKPILWTKSTNGKAMPIDPDPSPNGNIFLKGGEALVLTKYSVEGQRKLGNPLYTAHFVTCEYAKKHRRAKE